MKNKSILIAVLLIVLTACDTIISQNKLGQEPSNIKESRKAESHLKNEVVSTDTNSLTLEERKQLFQKKMFCFTQKDSFSVNNTCRDHYFQEQHYTFFKKNKTDYSEGCQLFSLPTKIGDIQPVIVCYNDVPFSEEGWLYTLTDEYEIVDSLLLFCYSGTSGTDDVAVLSSTTTAIWKGNKGIQQTKVNQYSFQNIDTTLIKDSIRSTYIIQNNGEISFENRAIKKFNTSTLKDPKNTNTYYKWIGKEKSTFLKVSRIGKKVQLRGIQYSNDKLENYFRLNGHVLDLNTNVLIGLKQQSTNDKEEEWRFVFDKTTVKMNHTSDLLKETEFKKVDYYSLPDKVRTAFYQFSYNF